MLTVTADQLRRAALAVVCTLAMMAPSLADEPCTLSYARATAIGRAAHAADATNVFTDYNGDQAAKLLAAINADPPVTTYSAERILVIERPDDDLVMVALVHDGCADKRIQTTPVKWGELRRGAIGDAL